MLSSLQFLILKTQENSGVLFLRVCWFVSTCLLIRRYVLRASSSFYFSIIYTLSIRCLLLVPPGSARSVVVVKGLCYVLAIHGRCCLSCCSLSCGCPRRVPAGFQCLLFSLMLTYRCCRYLHRNHCDKNDRIQMRNSIFFSMSSLRRELSPNTYAQVAREQSCENHLQQIESLSLAKLRVTCHVVRRDSSAIKFDRV